MKITKPLMAWLQGFYFTVTAAWPFLHLPSFLFVTGPKTDIWLLYTVSALLLVIGVVLLLAGYRKRVTPEVVLLAVFSASSLILIDLVYSSDNTIANIYRYDALAEAVLITGWAVAAFGNGKNNDNKENFSPES